MQDLLPKQAGGIVLRRLRAQDLTAFAAIRADPEVARYQSWPAMTGAETRAFLTEMERAPPFPRGDWWQIGIADAPTDALIGDLGLCLSKDGKSLELGITLARGTQGKGHARAAVQAAVSLVFEATAARRIVMITDARNTRALALFAALGLRQIDTLHEMGFPEPVLEIRRDAPWTSTCP